MLLHRRVTPPALALRVRRLSAPPVAAHSGQPSSSTPSARHDLPLQRPTRIAPTRAALCLLAMRARGLF